MGRIIRFFAVLSLAISVLACVDEPSPVKYTEPNVSFSTSEESISAMVGEPVELSAELLSGEKVSVLWFVEDEIVASSLKFSYSFDAPGTYSVRFVAKNGAGKVEKTYTVTVSDTFRVRLSVGDSTRIYRKQLSTLKVAAIVEAGSDITHNWLVNGELISDEAFFGTLKLDDVKDYNIEYHGYNGEGSFSKNFVVEVIERELEMSFSISDPVISLLAGRYLTISSRVMFGGTGLVQEWRKNGELIGTDSNLNWLFSEPGSYTLTFDAHNAKGETVHREWTVNVASSGIIFDDFESGPSLGAWWTLAQNIPGIQYSENPLKEGINTSAHCMIDAVNGTGGTSGYFDLTISKLIAAKPAIQISKYSILRFKAYLNGNNYYPFVQVNGKTQVPSLTPPSSSKEWIVLEYHFAEPFTASDKFTIRAMRDKNGNSISGRDELTNNRTVYFDDFEFVE